MISTKNLPLLLVACLLVAGRDVPAEDISNLYRLYDLTPVSATNPVVARVADCGIEIPVSELRAYVNAMPDTMPSLNGRTRPPLTLERKRAVLERLLGEHFLVWTGYQEKADESPGIAHLLAMTRDMLMRETFVAQQLGSSATSKIDRKSVV